MFENKYIQQRIEKAEALKELGINPYANDSKRELSIQDYLNKNSDIFDVETKRYESRKKLKS